MTTLTQLLTISGSPWVATDAYRLKNDCMDDIIERFDDFVHAVILQTICISGDPRGAGDGEQLRQSSHDFQVISWF